jgi:hypothetical protein
VSRYVIAIALDKQSDYARLRDAFGVSMERAQIVHLCLPADSRCGYPGQRAWAVTLGS